MIKPVSVASLFAAVVAVSAAAAQTDSQQTFFAAIGDGAPDRPGCAIGVVERGQIAAARYSGLADLETGALIGPTTRFNIASMSKQFTGAAVALLIAERRLSEDDPVRRHIPELPARFGDLTVRHLLGHQSGLRNHMALISFSPREELLSHEETVALVLRQGGTNSPPGHRFEYQSPSYVLLAEVVARASDSSFEEFLEERFFEPLGMTATGFDQGPGQSYNARAGEYERASATNLARGSSGITTTLEDLARWLPVLAGKPVDGHDLSARLQSYSVLSSGDRIPYNYGLSKQEEAFGVPGLRRLSHGGSTAGYRSTMSLFPGRGLGVIALCNSSDAPIQRVDAALAGLLDARGASRPAGSSADPVEPVAVPAQELERLAGSYVDEVTDGLREFVFEGGELKLRYFGQTYVLTPLGDWTFEVAGSRFRFSPTATGQTVTEIGDSAGPVFVKTDEAAGDDAPPVGTFRSPDVNGPLHLRTEGDALAVLSERGTAHLRRIGKNLFTSDDGDYAVVRYIPPVQDETARLSVTTHSGIRALVFSRDAIAF